MKKKLPKSVNGLGFFAVNGLGYNFCGIFEEKANYRSDFGKNRMEKSSELSVKFENLEKMSKGTRLDSKCRLGFGNKLRKKTGFSRN